MFDPDSCVDGDHSQDGGIIGVPSTPPPISLAELRQFLPQFRADLDVQVGDWVIVTPVRRGPLLNPLIAAWEKQGPNIAQGTDVATIPPRAPLHRFAVVLCPDGTVAVENLELAPVSQAKHFFTRRKRSRKTMVRPSMSAAEAEKSVVLYLHVRLGLVTATPPLVFGGAPGSLRALVRHGSVGDATPTEELLAVHLRSEAGVAPTLPPWLPDVEALAANDWKGSRLETTFSLPFPASVPKSTVSGHMA